MKNLVAFIIITLLEATISVVLLLQIPGDPKNAFVFGFSPTRLIMMGAVLSIVLFMMWLLFNLVRKNPQGQRIKTYVDRVIESYRSLFALFVALAIGISLGGVFIISWFFGGEKYPEIYQRLAPLVILETLFCIQLVYFLRTHLFIFIQKHQLQQVVLIVFFLLVSTIYLNLALDHARTKNLDERATDQNAYLDFTESIYDSGFKHTGGRNRMPVYPFIQALFYDPAQSRQASFLHGNEVNVVLSFGLLLILTLVVSKFLPRNLTLNFVLIAAFALYIFKAGYFQSELLYYFLFFMSFLTMCFMLVSPSILLGIATGIISALTHLTKASVLPLFAVFLGFYILKAVFNSYKMSLEPSNRIIYFQQIRHHFVIFLFVVGSFLIVVYPYIRESKQVYGQYFYNVNSTFYIWYDSWKQAEQGTKAYGDREGWPDMPPEEIPSFQKYIREHTLEQIKERLFNGARRQIINLTVPYGHFNYLLIYFISLIIGIAIGWQKSYPLIKKHKVLLGFVLTAFLLYLFLYSWYMAISGGYRFTLTLFLPMLFVLIFALKCIVEQFDVVYIFGLPIKVSRLFDLLNGIIVILVLVDLAFFIPGALNFKNFSE